MTITEETGVMMALEDFFNDKHVDMADQQLLSLSQELEQRHTGFNYLVDSISSVLVVVGPDDRILRWNHAAEETFGIPASEALGQEFVTCSIQWSSPDTAQIISSCRTAQGPVRLDDVGFTGPDGRHRLLGMNVAPLRNADEPETGFVLLGADITERRRQDALHSQARKLEAVGQLAAGIAHEINTPIQFVGDNTRFLQDAFTDGWTLLKQYIDLQERCEKGEPIEPALRKINEVRQDIDLDYLLDEIPRAIEQTLDGVQRVASIVRAMKAFSHPDIRGKRMVDLNQALESTLTIARNELKYVANVETDLDPDLPLVACDIDDMNQVFLNLLLNARDAIAEVVGDGGTGKGTITVSSRGEGGEVVITISDTGTGISEDIRHRIFDPFFTTKEVGRGTGQGLSIAYSVVVEKHHGALTFETETGKGTTFSIRLPISDSGTRHNEPIQR